MALLAALTVAVGCGQTGGEDPGLDSSDPAVGSTHPELEDIQANGLGPVGQVSSALVAPTCTGEQREAAARGQEVLANALVDAINAYAANTNNPTAVEFFGVRNEEQTMTVFYNLLWAYQTLLGDGQDFNIEYSCTPIPECDGNLAWSEHPYVTTVCNSNNTSFWQTVPYVMAHEMWHWLGWGDPNWLGEGSGDTIEAVRIYAQSDVGIAIEMPHAYYAYLYDFITPHVSQ